MNFKLPKLNFSGIAIAVALGIVVAVGLYQAQEELGLWFPTKGLL